MQVQDIIERIHRLSPGERVQVMHALADTFAKDNNRHSLTELRGLGADIWTDVDAQDYVNKLRDEWDHRP